MMISNYSYRAILIDPFKLSEVFSLAPYLVQTPKLTNGLVLVVFAVILVETVN